MATTLAPVEAREVLRCEYCTLVQFRTSSSLCRRCHKPLDKEEPVPPAITVCSPDTTSETSESGIHVDVAVRNARKMRHLSQRDLAARMNVPRTYISKIENAKAVPTLSSIQRLAEALEVSVCDLLSDPRSRRQDEVDSIVNDPFLAEMVPFLGQMDAFQRSILLNHARDLATGRRRSA
jgi:transcriptional regulator with XRE-family HTH domain